MAEDPTLEDEDSRLDASYAVLLHMDTDATIGAASGASTIGRKIEMVIIGWYVVSRKVEIGCERVCTLQ